MTAGSPSPPAGEGGTGGHGERAGIAASCATAPIPWSTQLLDLLSNAGLVAMPGAKAAPLSTTADFGQDSDALLLFLTQELLRRASKSAPRWPDINARCPQTKNGPRIEMASAMMEGRAELPVQRKQHIVGHLILMNVKTGAFLRGHGRDGLGQRGAIFDASAAAILGQTAAVR